MDKKNNNGIKKKLLVHFHLYYFDQVDYFIEKMKNITDIDWDLYVTYSQWNEEAFSKLKNFKSDANFIEVDNVGYDIWPFIYIIQNVNIDKYDYTLKLQTKRYMPKETPIIEFDYGYYWRNSLIDALLYDKAQFRKVLKKLEKKKTGMVCSIEYYLEEDLYLSFIKEEMAIFGFKKLSSRMCMGSIFIIKNDLLQILRNEKLYKERFAKGKPKSGVPISISHIYERIFSHIGINMGYRNVAISHDKEIYKRLYYKRIFENIMHFIFTLDRRGPTRKKYLKILGITWYESRKGKNEKQYSQILEQLNATKF